MASPALKKNFLILAGDAGPESFQEALRDPLSEKAKNFGFTPMVVVARDGMEFLRKAEMQRFDVIVIDAEAPKVKDPSFQRELAKFRAVSLVVVSDQEKDQLPKALQHGHVINKPVSADLFISLLIDAVNVKAITKDPSKPVRGAVDVRVINAILNATNKVFSAFQVSAKMTTAKPWNPNETLPGDIISVIDIKSPHFLGYLGVVLSEGSFLELASGMLMEKQTAITDENKDAAAEINNIIFGNSKVELSSYGVAMTIPRILPAGSQAIPCPPGSAGMQVPFQTESGTFSLFVAAFPLPSQ